MSRYTWGVHRKDSNHSEIAEALRKAGAEVFELHNVGKGAPDLVAIYLGKVFRLEVKNIATAYGRKKYKEREWQGGPVIRVINALHALNVIGATNGEGTKCTEATKV